MQGAPSYWWERMPCDVGYRRRALRQLAEPTIMHTRLWVLQALRELDREAEAEVREPVEVECAN